MNVYTEHQQTHRHRKQMYAYQRGEERGRDKLEVWDEQIQTTIHKIDKQPDLLQSIGNYTQYLVIIYNGM